MERSNGDSALKESEPNHDEHPRDHDGSGCPDLFCVRNRYRYVILLSAL